MSWILVSARRISPGAQLCASEIFPNPGSAGILPAVFVIETRRQDGGAPRDCKSAKNLRCALRNSSTPFMLANSLRISQSLVYAAHHHILKFFADHIHLWAARIGRPFQRLCPECAGQIGRDRE